jgi:hypothetical protein
VVTVKYRKMLEILSFGIICSFTSITIIAESAGGAIYGKNDVLSNHLIVDHAGGRFTSLQSDAANTTWIAMGRWDLVSNSSNSIQSNSNAVQFNATIDMRTIDNLAKHSHNISGLKLVNISSNSNPGSFTIVINGTATIDTPNGPHTSVPISIRIIDKAQDSSFPEATGGKIGKWIPEDGTISLLIDKSVQDHFGNTPVYGSVRK